MKILLPVLLFLCFFRFASSQSSSTVKIIFRDIPESSNSQVYLYLLSNRLGNQSLVDSVVVTDNNEASLHIPNGNEEGLYSTLIYARVNGQTMQSTFNFLFNKKSIEFNTCLKTPVDSMKVLSPGVNTNYFSFIKQKKHYATYYSKLLELKSMTSPVDTFYQDLNRQIKKVLSEQSKLFTKIRGDLSDNIASKYNRWFLSSEIYANEMNNVEYLRNHFLDRFDFSDPFIKNTDLLTAITSSYLFLYKDAGLTPAGQEQQLLAAIDKMMTYYSVDEEIVHYVASELEKEFKKLGMEKVMIHIADSYLLNSSGCTNSEAREKLKDEVELLKQLQPGHLAPNLKFDVDGIETLYEVNSDTVVVLFWATWCSHCRQSVPEIYAMLKNRPSVKVVAIALDADTDVWREETKKYPGWIHIQAKNMWDDKLVTPYAVYATPTIYLLGSNHKIVKKIKSVPELKGVME